MLETKAQIGDKPVVVIAHLAKPMIMAEVEPAASALFVHMGVQDQALMELISGAAEPSALLPFQLPANMKTVEEQFEDVPRDMLPYTDSEGNPYDFAFGMNWQGIIQDDRVRSYQ